jgi:putative oxidoreductase
VPISLRWAQESGRIDPIGLVREAGEWHACNGIFLRRLFSTFAQGWPGAGLLILRLVAGSTGVASGLQGLEVAQPGEPAMLGVAKIIASALVFVGLWTPVSGCLVTALALWAFIVKSGDPWSNVLLAAMGAALSMIGPGVWSLDARLFGWRRIVIRDRER